MYAATLVRKQVSLGSALMRNSTGVREGRCVYIQLCNLGIGVKAIQHEYTQ